MKAPGLDPKEINEAAGNDASPKSIDRLLSENKQQAIKKSSKDSGTSNKLVYDNDKPPSTPVAPSLNIPIVTHTSKEGGIQQQRNTSIVTGVSAIIIFSRAVTPRLCSLLYDCGAPRN